MAKVGFKKWVPLAVLATALFIVVLDTTIITVSIKNIIGDLHTDIKTVQWIITGYSLTLAAFTITCGRLGDLFGRKRIFLIGAILFGIGSLLAAVSQSSSMLFVSIAAIEGLGACFMLPTTAALVLANYQGKDRALAFGVYGAVAGGAATLGPLVGGFLTTNYSWRLCYLINPIIVLLVLAVSFVLHESKQVHARWPDVWSIMLSAFGLASLVYGIIESSTYGWIKAKQSYEIFGHFYSLQGVSISAYMIVIGILLLAGFIWRQAWLQKRGRQPLVSLKLFKNLQFMSGTTTLMVVIFAQFGLIFLLPIFYQGMLGRSAFQTGVAILPFALAIGVAAPLSGVLVGKFNKAPKYVIQVGILVALLGEILLRSEFGPDTTVWSVVPGLIVFGFGFGFALSQLANLTLSAVAVKDGGEAAGVNNTFRQIGTSFGQALIGALLISALITQLNKSVTSSKIIPNAMKPQVAMAAAGNAESLGTGTSGFNGSLPALIAQEVNRIKNEAIVHGIRTAMVAMIGATALAGGISFLLPKRSAGPEQLSV